MNEQDIQDYLYKHIPVTKAMGIKADVFNEEEVVLTAPLQPNINHRSTAFGGSISSLLTMTGWAYLRRLFDGHNPVPRLVISHSEVDYLKPVEGDMKARLTMPSEERSRRFMESYERFGKARITLTATLYTEGEALAGFSGVFVAMRPEEK